MQLLKNYSFPYVIASKPRTGFLGLFIEDCLKEIASSEKSLEFLLTDLGKPSNYTYIEWDRLKGYDNWIEFDESGGRIHKD